jgi:hypothetical protein
MSCSCEHRCMTKAEMRKRHGTPEEFRAAVLNAIGDISVHEACAAIEKYDLEYANADEV